MFFINTVLNSKVGQDMKKLKHEEAYAFYFKRIKGKMTFIEHIKFGLGNRFRIKDIDYKVVLNRYDEIKAHALVLVHNHPKIPFLLSKKVEPSYYDLHFTVYLMHACKQRNINFIDHIIISKYGYFSFYEKNLME